MPNPALPDFGVEPAAQLPDFGGSAALPDFGPTPDELKAQLASTRRMGAVEGAVTKGFDFAEQLMKATADMPTTLLNLPSKLTGSPDAFTPGKPVVNFPTADPQQVADALDVLHGDFGGPSRKPTKAEEVISGLQQAVAQTGSSFTTPEMLAALPAGGSPKLMAAFAAQMSKDLPEQVGQAATAAGDSEMPLDQRTLAIAQPAIVTAMLGHMVHSANPDLLASDKTKFPLGKNVDLAGLENDLTPVGRPESSDAASNTKNVPAAAAPAEPPAQSPVPEPASTIAAQVAATHDPATPKAVTLITPGETPPEEHGLVEVWSNQGLLLVNPKKVSPVAALKQFNAGGGGQLLGMSTDVKPAGALDGTELAIGVQTKTADGIPAQEEVATPDTLEAAIAAGKKIAPNGTVEIKSPEQVIAQRLAAQELKPSVPIRVAAATESYPAQLTSVDPAWLVASHDGQSFTPNPLHPGNTRDYTGNVGEQEKVDQGARGWQSDRYVTDSPDAAVGPVQAGWVTQDVPPQVAKTPAYDEALKAAIVTDKPQGAEFRNNKFQVQPDGRIAVLTVLGGNSRRMMIDRMTPENRAGLDALQAQRLPRYGVVHNPGGIAARVLDEHFDTSQPDRIRQVMDQLNPAPGRRQATTERARLDAELKIDPAWLLQQKMDASPVEAQGAVKEILGQADKLGVDRNNLSATAESGQESQTYLQQLQLYGAFKNRLVVNAWGDNRPGQAPLRSLIEASVKPMLELRNKGLGGIADLYSQMLGTVTTYTGRGMKLPDAIRTASQQIEMSADSRTVERLAAALGDELRSSNGDIPELMRMIGEGAKGFDGGTGASLFGGAETPDAMMARTIEAAQKKSGRWDEIQKRNEAEQARRAKEAAKPVQIFTDGADVNKGNDELENLLGLKEDSADYKKNFTGRKSFRTELQSEGASGRSNESLPASGKFFLTPENRLMRVDDHEPAAAKILGRKYNPDDSWMDRHLSELHNRGWVRVVKQGNQISFTGPTRASQLRELKNIAIENRLTLENANKGGKIIYDPNADAAGLHDDQPKYDTTGKPINPNANAIVDKLARLGGALLEKSDNKGFPQFVEMMRTNYGQKPEVWKQVAPFLKEAYNQIRDTTEARSWANSLTKRDDLENKYDNAGNYIDRTHANAGGDLRGGGADATGIPSGAGRGGRPGIRIIDEGSLPQPTAHVSRDGYTGASGARADETQRFGVNLALTRFLDLKQKVFLLADGTGVGKTLEQLMTAAEMVKRTGKSALIVMRPGKLKSGDYIAEANRFGVPLSRIEFASWNDVQRGAVPAKNRGLIIYDEAHAIKNFTTATAKQARVLTEAADHVMHATATPMAHSHEAAYFLSEISGQTIEQVEKRLGFQLVPQTDGAGKVTGYDIKLDKGVTPAMVLRNLIDIRQAAVKAGGLLRREYPYHGSFYYKISELGQSLVEHNLIKDYFTDNINRSQSMTAKKHWSGQRTQTLQRWGEHLQAPKMLAAILDDLRNGRVSVVFGKTIGRQQVKGYKSRAEKVLTTWSVPGLLETLAKELDKRGIEYAQVFNDSPTAKANAVRSFQQGKARVLLATPQSGGESFSMDDIVGDRPRNAHSTLPRGGVTVDQMVGRVSRRNTASPANFNFYYARDNFGDQRGVINLDAQIATVRAIQTGEDIDFSRLDWLKEKADGYAKQQGLKEESRYDWNGRLRQTVERNTAPSMAVPYPEAAPLRDEQMELPGSAAPGSGSAGRAGTGAGGDQTGTAGAPGGGQISGDTYGGTGTGEARTGARSVTDYLHLNSPLALAQQFSGGVKRLATTVLDFIHGDVPTFDIRGKKLSSPQDFAMLQLVTRTPYFESLKSAWVDDKLVAVQSRIERVGSLDTIGKGGKDIERMVDEMLAARPKGINRLLIGHNHPSGDPQPSKGDQIFQSYLEKRCKEEGIDLIDHVITNGLKFYSFRTVGTQHFDKPVNAAWEKQARQLLPYITPGQYGDSFKRAVDSLRQANPNSAHVIVATTRSHVTAIDRVDLKPPVGAKFADWVARLGAHIYEVAAQEGGKNIFLDLPMLSTDEASHAWVMLKGLLPGLEVQDIASKEHSSLAANSMGGPTGSRSEYLDPAFNALQRLVAEKSNAGEPVNLLRFQIDGIEKKFLGQQDFAPGGYADDHRASLPAAQDIAAREARAQQQAAERAQAHAQDIAKPTARQGDLLDNGDFRLMDAPADQQPDYKPGEGEDVSMRAAKIQADTELPADVRAKIDPYYKVIPNATAKEVAAQVSTGFVRAQDMASAFLQNKFADLPGAHQVAVVAKMLTRLADEQKVAERQGNAAQAQALADLQVQTLNHSRAQLSTDVAQTLQAHNIFYENFSPAAWLAEFRNTVGKAAAQRVELATGAPKGSIEPTVPGVAGGIAQHIADSFKASNPQLAQLIEEHFTGKGEQGKTLAQKITELTGKQDAEAQAVARKVEKVYETEVEKFKRQHKIPAMDTETQRETLRRAKELDALPRDSVQRRDATTQLQNWLGQKKGFQWWEAPMEFWMANLVSGLPTAEKIIRNNALTAGAEMGLQMVQHPTAIKQIVEMGLRAVPRSANEALRILKTGRSGRPGDKWEERPSALPVVLHQFAQAVFRTHHAMHAFTWYPLQETKAVVLAREAAKAQGLSIYGGEVGKTAAQYLANTGEARAKANAQALTEGLKPGTTLYNSRGREIQEQMRDPDLMMNARDFAALGTYMNDTYGLMGVVGDAFKAAAKKEPALRLVQPFVDLPVNIFNSLLNYSPVGYWRAGRAAGFKLLIGREGNTGKLFGKEVTDPTAIQDQMARATVGTLGLLGLMIGAGAQVSSQNPSLMLTSSGPTDPNHRKQLEATGWIPNSIKIGDKYVPYLDQPGAAVMSYVGNIMDAIRYGKLEKQDALNRAWFGLMGLRSVVLDSSMLQGPVNYLDTSTSGKKTQGMFVRLVSGFVVPKLAQNIDQIFDPTKYRADDIGALLLREVPFARAHGEADLNVFGEPVSAPLSQRFYSTVQGDPLMQLLGGRQLWPSMPVDPELTPAETRQIILKRGPILRAQLQAHYADLATLPPQQAQAMVTRISEIATKATKESLGLDYVSRLRKADGN